MNSYKIAQLVTNVVTKEPRFERLSAAYKIPYTDKADIVIDVTKEDIKKIANEHPNLKDKDCTYSAVATKFYLKLIDFDGMMLHSAAVVLDDNAYLFMATSGTGKSTHANLLLEYFKDRAYILNGDLPAIRLVDDTFYAYGTPWSGKEEVNINKRVPIKAIVILERSKVNTVRKATSMEAMQMILSQTIRSNNADTMTKLFDTMEKLLKKVPVYKMGCNISTKAVQMIYNEINRG